MEFKHGQLLEASYHSLGDADNKKGITDTLKQKLVGQKLYDENWRWEDVVEQIQEEDTSARQTEDKITWLKKMLPSNHNV